jgi:hypothetical protein
LIVGSGGAQPVPYSVSATNPLPILLNRGVSNLVSAVILACIVVCGLLPRVRVKAFSRASAVRTAGDMGRLTLSNKRNAASAKVK